MSIIRAGAVQVDITPRSPQFLYGYPHVPRVSTGVHDPLLSTALCLDDGATATMFIANDLIFVPREIAERVRARLAELTGIPAGHIMVTATHTHSGPVTVRYLSNEADPVVPGPDPAYLQQAEQGMIDAGRRAWESRQPGEIGLVIADGAAVGTNRRDPSGPRDAQVPVLLARTADTHQFIAAMMVCSMHPTVLHEDSTLISGDFPAMARQYMQQHLLGRDCPIVYHTGAAGNQSPRHVTRGNTFAEAERLGWALGDAIVRAATQAEYQRKLRISCARELLADLRRAAATWLAAGGCVLLAIALWRLTDGLTELVAVRALFVLTTAYSLGAGYVLPWYELPQWLATAVLLGLLSAEGWRRFRPLLLLLVARSTVLALAYVPGRVQLPDDVETVTLGFRFVASPLATLAVWVALAVMYRRARTVWSGVTARS